MGKYLLLVVMLCVSAFVVKGQATLRGAVKDEANEPVADAYVTLYPKGSNVMLTYAVTDTKGSYRLSFRHATDTVCVTVARFDYAKESRCIANESQRLDIFLKSEITQLREVKVQPRKVWRSRDTINFSVLQFSDKGDRTIADVLRKLPGIEVTNSGKIKYNGEDINRFMVEDMDLMGGQYGVITNNLGNKHVEPYRCTKTTSLLRLSKRPVCLIEPLLTLY